MTEEQAQKYRESLASINYHVKRIAEELGIGLEKYQGKGKKDGLLLFWKDVMDQMDLEFAKEFHSMLKKHDDLSDFSAQFRGIIIDRIDELERGEEVGVEVV